MQDTKLDIPEIEIYQELLEGREPPHPPGVAAAKLLDEYIWHLANSARFPMSRGRRRRAAHIVDLFRQGKELVDFITTNSNHNQGDL